MNKVLNKENFILLYLTLITGAYPIFFIPSKIQVLTHFSRYHSVLFHYFLVFTFFFLVPAILLTYRYHEALSQYGLNFKEKIKGIKFILIVMPLLFVLIFFAAKQPEIINEYPLAKVKVGSMLLIMELFYLLYYVGWEFLFRGMILFGLKKYNLIFLLVLSTIPSTLLHYSKPTGEIVLAIVAGFILGYYVYKYKTLWFAILIHWLVGLMTDLIVILRNT